MPTKKYGKDAKQKPRTSADCKDQPFIIELRIKIDKIGHGNNPELQT